MDWWHWWTHVLRSSSLPEIDKMCLLNYPSRFDVWCCNCRICQGFASGGDARLNSGYILFSFVCTVNPQFWVINKNRMMGHFQRNTFFHARFGTLHWCTHVITLLWDFDQSQGVNCSVNFSVWQLACNWWGLRKNRHYTWLLGHIIPQLRQGV